MTTSSPPRRFGLEPGGRAAGVVGRVQLLGDDPFQIHAAGALEDGLAGGGEVIDVADAGAGGLGDAVDVRLQPGLAFRQGQFAQVFRAVEQQVEGE